MIMRSTCIAVLLFAGLLGVASLGFAGSESYDFELLKASAAIAVGPSASKVAIPTGSDFPCGAVITVEDADVRYRVDGSSPTASVGHKVTAGNSVIIDSLADLRRFVAIAASATSTGTLNATYLRGCR